MNQSKEQLERLCFSLRDEMREAASKVDNLSQELGSLEGSVRMQARLLEDNSKRMLVSGGRRDGSGGVCWLGSEEDGGSSSEDGE